VNARAAADLIATRLRRDLQVEQVWLFGSQARGDATADSDIDLLAIASESSQTRFQRAVAARRALSDIRVPMDVIVLTRQEWEQELLAPSSLSSTVRREGIPLLHDESES
jgi:predicted nucleotidyltransferase